MGVIQLNRHMLRQESNIVINLGIVAKYIPQRTGHQKILLRQPQLFSGQHLIGWIEYF